MKTIPLENKTLWCVLLVALCLTIVYSWGCKDTLKATADSSVGKADALKPDSNFTQPNKEAGAKIDASAGNGVSKSVGKTGGVIAAGETKVTIPEEALESDTDLTVQELSTDEATKVAGDAKLKSKVYAFLPHGTIFQKPVTIELPYTEDGSKVEVVKKATPTSSMWEKVSATFENKVAKFETNSFSYYLVREVILSCNDEAYKEAWSTFRSKLSTYRACTPGGVGCNNPCQYEAKYTANGNCITIGFAASQNAVDQMKLAFEDLLKEIKDYPCGYEAPPCGVSIEWSSPSYCGDNNKCGKCPYCSDNAKPKKCAGEPCVSCDESTDSVCVSTESNTVQIAKTANGSDVNFYLRYNDDHVQTCDALALVFEDSDSEEDEPQYQFRPLSPGNELHLGPSYTSATNQTWYYKLVWAVFMTDADCKNTPKLGCTNSEDTSCPSTVHGKPSGRPAPGDDLLLFNIPWYNGSEWRLGTYIINRSMACTANVKITHTTQYASEPSESYSENREIQPASWDYLGTTMDGSAYDGYTHYRYQISQASWK